MRQNLEKPLFLGFLTISLLLHAVIYFGSPQPYVLHFSNSSLEIITEKPSAPNSSDYTGTLPKQKKYSESTKPEKLVANQTVVPDETETEAIDPKTVDQVPTEELPPPITPELLSSSEAKSLPVPLQQQTASLLSNHRETLHFDIYWLGMHVGTAILDALNEDSGITITSRVSSNSVISAFYRVEDFAECRIINGRASTFKLKQQEGKHRGDKETIFDYSQNRITFLNNLRNEVKHYPMNDKKFWDVISGFYYVRTMPLKIGQKVHIDIFDSCRFVNTDVDVLRTEMLTLLDGKEIETIVIKPVIVTDGLFKKTGDIYIWLTNDTSRTPVRVETNIKIGTVTAELRGIEVE